MPVKGARMRLRRFRHRFGGKALQLQVRPKLAWYAYAAGGALAAFVLMAFFNFLSSMLQPPEARDMAQLRERLAQLEEQVVQGGGVLSSLEMTHSANRLLSDELRLVADDYSILKDDLAYFLQLVPVGSREGEVRLDRLALRSDPGPSNRYRYSVMVGYQSGRQPQEFSGTLQFVLTVFRDGKDVTLVLPERNAAAGSFAVKTRHWLRKEGELELPPGDQLKKAEVRLMQGKTLRASTAITL